MKAEIYEISTTKFGKFNDKKLSIELATSSVPSNLAEGIKGKIYVSLSQELTADEKTSLDAIIANHDGEPPKASDRKFVVARENVILDINQMGIYHPLINDDDLVVYLGVIDNKINAFIRSGNSYDLKRTIFAHAGVQDISGTPALQEDGVTPVDTSTLPHYNFLQTTSNPLTGSKVFQFFASQVDVAANI